MKFEIKNAVIPLLLINIGVFILQIFLGNDFTSTFLLVSDDIFSRPWIIITYMFLHGGPSHLLFNMYVLFIFGPLLEQRIGAKRFLFIYFLSGIIAAFGSSLFYDFSLGASGAIMGMLGVLIILMPDLQLLFFFIVPMSLRTAAVLFVLIDVYGIFNPSGTANVGHLVGLGTGLIYGLLLRKEKIKFDKKFSSKTDLDSTDVEEYLKSGKI